jgi:hypothetical protein
MPGSAWFADIKLLILVFFLLDDHKREVFPQDALFNTATLNYTIGTDNPASLH